jgi:DNA-binding transcriptional regulator YiaG
MIFPVAVKEGLPPVIRKLIKWRETNGLSQRAAAQVMMDHNVEVPVSTLQKWENGLREPGKLATKALRDFLKAHPKIENPPVFKPGPKR